MWHLDGHFDKISATGSKDKVEDEARGRYVDPLSDPGFKTIFRNEDILTAFLTDLIEPESPITGITYLDKEMLGNVVTERKAVYDFRSMKAKNYSHPLLHLSDFTACALPSK